MPSPTQILLVDNDAVTMQKVSHLSVDVAVVTVARTGQAALQHFPGRHFDLALISVALPDMSGVTLSAALAQLQPTMRRILLTNGEEFDELTDCLERFGVSGLLLRPIAAEGILEEITLSAA